MAAEPWRPPPAFNVIATVFAFAAALGLGWLAWSYYEYAPWSRDGRVRVYTVMVAPEVSGTVVKVPVKDNQFVHKGDLLFEIDPGTFKNNVTQAEGALAAAQSRATYLAANARRTNALSDLAATAEQKQDQTEIAIAARNTALQQQGALDQANLNLHRTKLYATVNGWVTNLTLQPGSYAASGQMAMTLVDADSYWIEGYFAETQLPRIKIGDEVRMVMMAYPKTPVRGRVAGIGRGISVENAQAGVQGLPTVNPIFTWVRLAQRVPVRVELDDVPCPITLAAGLTVTVSVLDRAPAVGLAAGRRGAEAAGACEAPRTARNP